MRTHDFKIRLKDPVKNWLAMRAAEHDRSMSGELQDILKIMMHIEPIFAVVRRVRVDDGEIFTAALGKAQTDFFQGQSKVEAMRAARARLRELGWPRASINFVDLDEAEINWDAR